MAIEVLACGNVNIHDNWCPSSITIEHYLTIVALLLQTDARTLAMIKCSSHNDDIISLDANTNFFFFKLRSNHWCFYRRRDFTCSCYTLGFVLRQKVRETRELY